MGHNLIKNFVGIGLQKVVRIIEQLLLIPFFLKHWGPEYYGAWVTITTIPTVLSLSDLGLSTAAGNLIVLRYAKKDYDGALRAANAGHKLISITVISVGILAAILYFIINKISWIKNFALPQNEIFGIVFFLVIARVLNFYCQLYEAYFRAANKASIGIHLATGVSLTRIIAQIIILISGFGGLAIAQCEFIIVIFSIFFFRKSARSVLPKFLEHKCESAWTQDAPEMLKKGLGYMGSPAWQALYFQGTTLVVWKLLGVEAVAIFNTMRTLSRSIAQIYSMINNAVYPEIQYKIGVGDMPAARKMFRLSVSAAFLTGLVGASFLYLVGPTVYKFWTGGSLTAPISVWIAFIIGIILNATWWTAGMVFRAANVPGRFAVIGMLGSLCSVVGAYLLGRDFGLLGVVIGSVLLEVVMFFWVIPQGCVILCQNPATLLKDLLQDFQSVKDMIVACVNTRLKRYEKL